MQAKCNEKQPSIKGYNKKLPIEEVCDNVHKLSFPGTNIDYW